MITDDKVECIDVVSADSSKLIVDLLKDKVTSFSPHTGTSAPENEQAKKTNS